MNLSQLGWSHFFQQQLDPEDIETFPARVRRQDINQYHLISEAGELSGFLPGRFRNEALSKADLPTVGDWVLCRKIAGGDTDQVQIESLLDRKSKFSRKEAGEQIDEQIVAANVDHVFIVAGLDDDFNPNRIERYLLLSWDSGALPVLLLSKSDLCTDLDQKIASLQPITRGTPIHPVSTLDSTGVEDVRAYLSTGTTCALMGSSGVGKSTLINALLGYEKFETGTVRDDDSKGRHTTTFRELVVIDGGGIIIDTPGMRELQLWADSESLANTFDDIETLATSCKFSDCKHESEPGCAVLAAIETGKLEYERLRHYLKLQRELAHFESQQNVVARAEKKQERKRFKKLIRNRPTKRD